MSFCKSKDICEDVDNGIKAAKNLPDVKETAPVLSKNPSDQEMLTWLNQIKSNANTATDFFNAELPNLLIDVENLETQLNNIFS